MKKPGTTTRRNGTVRCAIYTRKSSEEGHEQEFNSLQAQREACWMGGVPPLGYRAQDGKLTIVESEAETVRLIFRRYAELGSVRLLKDELDARSIHSRLRRAPRAASREVSHSPAARFT
jgi:hypothetical protein